MHLFVNRRRVTTLEHNLVGELAQQGHAKYVIDALQLQLSQTFMDGIQLSKFYRHTARKGKTSKELQISVKQKFPAQSYFCNLQGVPCIPSLSDPAAKPLVNKVVSAEHAT